MVLMIVMAEEVMVVGLPRTLILIDYVEVKLAKAVETGRGRKVKVDLKKTRCMKIQMAVLTSF